MNINRRLLNLARDSRAALTMTVLAGAMGGLLTIGQARGLSLAVARVFLDGQNLQDVSQLLRGLLFIIAGRSVLVWVGEISAKAIAVRVKNDLRERLFAHILKLGPAYTRRERTGELTVAAVEGIEALDAYFSQYLPQLALAALVPLSILIFVFPLDPLSGLILFLTAPLIPVFMILIGKAAEALTHQQYETLSRLSAHFLDSLQGLTILKQFGRSKSHADTITQASDQFRDTTMKVLRVTFLSALVLELVATLSTAVIAVEIGLRLLYARMSFEQAFFLLILAPEFYMPLRMLGLRFHAGMNGSSAARKIYEILDLPVLSDQLIGDLESGSREQEENIFRHHASRITLDRVSFTYPDETVPALQDISLIIQPGQHIALVGASGAGKSTLVQILLGFVSPGEGQILVDGQPLARIPGEDWEEMIAWVPQKPFIFNTSIAENIRLGQPNASMDVIKDAAQAAHLHEFIESLPDGYETIVEEAGARLSSGQAQRLALARAFLKNAPILILDEPTSSLDPVLEIQLAESTQKLIGQGKQLRTTSEEPCRTVITIAHRLNTIAQADQINVLQNGRIVERGSHRELLAKKGAYAKIIKSGPRKYSADSQPLQQPPRDLEPFTISTHQPAKIQSKNGQPYGRAKVGPVNVIFRLLRFLDGSWGQIAVSVLIGMATILSSIGLIGVSSWLISAAALHPSVAELQVAIVGVRFFGISRGVFRYLERLVSHNITFRLLSRLRTWFFQAIEPLAPARLMQHHSGDLLSRVITDVNTLENFYIRVVSPLIVAALISLGCAAYLGHFDPRMGWVLLAFLVGLGIGVPLLAHLISRKPGCELVACRASLHAQLVDGVQGLADLLAFGRAADRNNQIVQMGRAYGQVQQRMARITGFHSGLSLLLANLGMWTVLILGINAVSAGAIPGVMLGALTLIALVSFEAVQPLPLAAQMLGETSESARKLFELVDVEPEIPEPEGQLTTRGLPANIEFSNLSFTYPGTREPALKNISFDLPEGRTVAIVGPSGAGKSTLMNLLLRFWDFRTGEIRFGGHSLRIFPPDDLRAQIAVVSQRSYFFNASLRENLILGHPNASQAEIETAAQQAQIHEFITALPKGYDTYIGEQGLRLSGGERQRLAIARALLKNSPILVLDEPTDNLDPITAGQVLETLFSVARRTTRDLQSRSTLLITHRLVGLENVDEIIVLDSGQIIERGSQADLLRANGFYAHLYGLQNRILDS